MGRRLRLCRRIVRLSSRTDTRSIYIFIHNMIVLLELQCAYLINTFYVMFNCSFFFPNVFVFTLYC